MTFRLERLSVHQQTMLIVFAALCGTEALVMVFYSIFFEDRLALDLVLSGIIVILVGYPLGYFFVSQNMKLRQMAVDLDRAARIDDLTGLANRKTFFREAGDIISRATDQRGAFLYIDVDHFKQLNDGHGHATGDAVLREMGAVVRGCVRDGDVAARLGGEEFGIYLPRADLSIALHVAEHIRRKVAGIGRPVGLGGITVSIGLSLRQTSDSLDSLMNRADRNLYAAKEEGRDRVVAEAQVDRAA